MPERIWSKRGKLFPYLLLNIVLFIFVATAFLFYTASERNIDEAEENRYKSLQIANELRQSSDQLTNLVRLYVIQRDKKYKTYFQMILDIRNGKRPRPNDYSYAYWDLVIANKLPAPSEEGETISIYESMRNANFHESDFILLSESKLKSDQLTKIEFEAMSIAERDMRKGSNPNPKAIALLYDDNYLHAKAEIMKPINDLYNQLNDRTTKAIEDAKDIVFFLRTILIATGIFFAISLFLTHRSLTSIIGGSVDEAFRKISLLGDGNFYGDIHPVDHRNSILGRLNTTQKRLQELYENGESTKQRLINSESRLREILDNVSACIYLKDINGKYIFANKEVCNLFGHPFEEIINQTDEKFLNKDAAKILIANDKSVLIDGKTLRTEESIRNLIDEKVTTYLTVKLPLRNENGEIYALCGISTDISITKEIQNELERAKDSAEIANRAKSEFLASMSHEIRTPLNGVIGLTQILFKTNLDEEQKSLVTTIASAGKSLLIILNDILDFSKIEVGKMKIEKLSFDFYHLVSEVYDLLAIESKWKSIDLKLEIDSEVPQYIYSDPGRIRQIIFNLLGNAIKFTEKGSVVLRVKRESDKIRIEVEDTGIGIAKDKMESIFHKFSQADTSTSRKYGGTGLGLSISERLVSLLGGTIGVSSELGIGSLFYCILPIENEDSTNVNQPSDKNSNKLNSLESMFVNQNFLIVEDNILNQKVMGGLLRKFNINFDVAENGEEAVTLFQQNKYDLILMDCEMPVMDGFVATTKIRELEKNKSEKTIIIAVTAHVLKEHKEKCFAVGMDGFISKPFYIETLFQTYNEISTTKDMA
ncbi:PAS domain-containing sensor histidine kinase [Leptospira congkakensis]|uniref:histidine kinase n=1 Tax=Leptospira congkakensis TaxID=2484932 RepID=A0A4Z1A1N4_9LEPT|nr:PAS domain-containing sensor histidine kinase [Leptospira congkakensis]TGL85099.1 PAS domain-containing sensor histidine kinase [Leptospira congkakensis]TGL92811.1 PAS domain-containing sensor histidine kinase [Leptospira congkakensis]TGL95548.1 PAS domain-containing sensor histidine kinase [Leptospira congkakensis]